MWMRGGCLFAITFLYMLQLLLLTTPVLMDPGWDGGVLDYLCFSDYQYQYQYSGYCCSHFYYIWWLLPHGLYLCHYGSTMVMECFKAAAWELYYNQEPTPTSALT